MKEKQCLSILFKSKKEHEVKRSDVGGGPRSCEKNYNLTRQHYSSFAMQIEFTFEDRMLCRMSAGVSEHVAHACAAAAWSSAVYAEMVKKDDRCKYQQKRGAGTQ